METNDHKIYRVDVSIPYKFRDDPEYVANEMARAWARIWKDVVEQKTATEGADFKPSDKFDADGITIEPHWGYSRGAVLDAKHLYMRPGKIIPLNAPRRFYFWKDKWAQLRNFLKGGGTH
jgi:hypothetical protein